MDKSGRTGSGSCGQMVNGLAFYSDDPKSNPAEVINYKSYEQKVKINDKVAGNCPF